MIEYLCFDKVTFEIYGIGHTPEAALRDACERNFTPGFLGFEDWESADFSMDASCVSGNWAVAEQPEYQQAFEDAIRATELA